MKIAVDLDGVVWTYPDLFKAMISAFQKDGHEVGILTAHCEDLQDIDMSFWRRLGIPEPNFYISRKIGEYCSETGTWKANKVLENNIDILFDDADGGMWEREFIETAPHKLFRVY